MSFSMNFNIDLIPDRNLVNSKIYGIWKLETAREYHQEFKIVAKSLVGKKWAKVVNLSNWKPSYPEMVKSIGDHMRWSRENGNTLAIYIIDNPITRTQLKKMFKSGKTEPISVTVRSREEAEKILIQHGF